MHSPALLLTGKRNVTFGRSPFLDRVEIDATYLAENVVHVTEILRDELGVEGVAILVEIIIGDPFGNVRKNVFQVFNAVIAGFDGIIAEIFSKGARVVHAHKLLTAVAVERVSGFFVDPLFCDGLFFFGGFVAGDGSV